MFRDVDVVADDGEAICVAHGFCKAADQLLYRLIYQLFTGEICAGQLQAQSHNAATQSTAHAANFHASAKAGADFQHLLKLIGIDKLLQYALSAIQARIVGCFCVLLLLKCSLHHASPQTN